MEFTKEQVPVEQVLPAAPQHSRSKLHSAFGLHGSFRGNMQAYGERKRLAGPYGDNAGEPDGVGTAGVSARRSSCRKQVQRIPSRPYLQLWAYIDIPYSAGQVR